MMTSLASNGTKDIEENQWLGKANRINSDNFNATSLKLVEGFDHLFPYLLIFHNIFAQGHGFDVLGVTNSKYFVSLH